MEMRMGKLENKINELATAILEEKSLEDFLEEQDLTAQEVIEYLFKAGLVELELEEDS